MADKQFARSGPAEFDVLADDDPLAELARIVGYDARPAVQQLQELQRHQETVRQEPAFDLEDELLRAFDSYEAPRSQPQPAPQPIEEPRFEPAALEPAPSEPVASEPVASEPVAFEPAVAEPVAEAADEPTEPMFYQPEPVFHQPESAEVQPTPAFASHYAEAQSLPADSLADTPEPVVATEVEPAADEPIADEPVFDLERELELSLGEADLLLDGADEAQAVEPEAAIADAWQAPATDLTADWAEPAHVTAPQPAYEEPSFDIAAELRSEEFSYAPELSVAEARVEEPAHQDELLADIERFPVPAATALVAAAVQSHPALHASAPPVVAPAVATATPVAAPVKKSPYPFTPTFSRATPVASSSGVAQQRAFAGPIVSQPVPAAAVTAPIAEPMVATPAAAPVAEVSRPAEPEHEPSFDIENFEMELSDVASSLDLSDFGALDEVAVEAPSAMARQVDEPVAPQPESVSQAFEVAAPVERQDTQPESTLPFDPAMIAEAENGVAPIADMDVPQLPVIETEKPVAYPADYDLDIDAEMAQLFGTPAPVAKDARPAAADKAEVVRATPAANANAPGGAGALDDFDEFEKAMEEDFRRSIVERKTVTRDAERLSAAQSQDDAGEYREYGAARRSQRTMLLAASVAGVIILGGAAVYAWMGGSDAVTSAEGPKIILADKGPVKVVPEEKGGKTVPNQDKAVYDRVAGAQAGAPQQEALVSSTEEPMDVVQKTLTPETLPLEGNDDTDGLQATVPADDEDGARLLPDGGNAETATQDEEKTPAVAPRKVRTMIVKPDGTLVAREEPVAAPATDVAGAQPLPETPSKEVAAVGAEAGVDINAAGQATGNADQVALAATGNATIDQVPVRNVTTTATADKAPTPQTRPAEQPAKVATATTEGTNLRPAEEQAAPAADTQAAQQMATASVPAGGYFIQVASLPSEAEAQKSYNSLSSKFGNVIGGRGVDIRKAEIAGKGTYYRVRIPAGSKEEANALCSKYKGAGGSCLVTK
ncbi:SPOR domain-containing protein [Ensifer sp. MJa1]|uniref:SPOR domain-containing protein n=1 Tax=Ensifer sp. MJa1 TaxID=2919888 RepID=UPI003009B983